MSLVQDVNLAVAIHYSTRYAYGDTVPRLRFGLIMILLHGLPSSEYSAHVNPINSDIHRFYGESAIQGSQISIYVVIAIRSSSCSCEENH